MNTISGLSVKLILLSFLGFALFPAQADAAKLIKLSKLFCEDTTEAGEDEVYITISVDGVPHRLPSSSYHSMNEDDRELETWDLNKEYRVEQLLVVTVYEEDDGANADDTIGSLVLAMGPQLANGEFTKKWTEEAEYTLHYEIRDTPVNQNTTASQTADSRGRTHLDLPAVINQASRWSVDTRVVDNRITDLGNLTQAKFEERNDSDSDAHIHGLTYMQNKRFVLAASLESVGTAFTDTCGLMAWSEPYDWDANPDGELKWKARCLFEDWHPSILQSAGDYIAATDSNRVKFYKLGANSAGPARINNLSINPRHYLQTMGFTYRVADGHYYVVTSRVADQGYRAIELFRDSLVVGRTPTGAPCGNLERQDCKFVSLGTIDNVHSSASGTSLIDQTNGKLVLVTMYSSNSDGKGYIDDFVRATEIDVATMTAVERYSAENMGIAQWESKFRRPSCRWACTVNVVNNEVYYSMAARHIYDDGEFEIGIHRIWP